MERRRSGRGEMPAALSVSPDAPALRDLRIMLDQINLRVGDVAGNAARVRAAMDDARGLGVDLLVFPEMTLCGYPAEDLLLRPEFVARCEAAIQDLAQHSKGLTAMVGFAHHRGDDLFNAAAILHDGALDDVYHKTYLPNYGVFDEQRYFGEGRTFPVHDLSGVKLGVSICEDIWYAAGPPQLQALAGAEVLVNLSASPYAIEKPAYRERMLATRAGDTGAFVVFCNLVGGQDELVFDGNSLVLDPDGNVLARGASMQEDRIVMDIHPGEVLRDRLLDPRIRKARLIRTNPNRTPTRTLHPIARPAGERPLLLPQDLPEPPAEPKLAEIYAALVLGTRDYLHKNGFREAVLGLSGGIDSALTAAVAVDALGAENVHGIAMPSRYSSKESLADAQAMAESSGLSLIEQPIDSVFQAYLDALAPLFEGHEADVTEENLQSRIRGAIIMACSNKFGWLPLTTGNKSENAVGYATLYGDTVGGFAPLKDVPKTLVFELARWRNRQGDGDFIPEHSITRPPSAELKPDQLDSDSLPEYSVLDPILEGYVERELGVDELVERGFDRATVERVAKLVDRAEYKRRQMPPGVKITARAFGRERRMPITRGSSTTKPPASDA